MARILYAEDQGSMRTVVKVILEGEGHEVVAVRDGQQALQRLDDLGDVDLVMTDIQMPHLDGYSLIEKLNERANKPPVIVHSTEFDENKVAYSGELRRISKEGNPPFGDELRATVRKLLDY